MRAKHIIGNFERFFEGTPNCPERSEGQFWGLKGPGPLEKPREFADYSVFSAYEK